MVFARRWGRWSALALLPLLNVSYFSEEREFPRQLLVAAVAVSGLIGAAASGFSVDRTWVRRALAFALVMVTCGLAAPSLGRTLYGPYEGHQGVLAACGLLALMASTPRLPTSRRDACLVALALGILQSILALVQFAGDRAPSGTFGHAMFLAIFLTLAALAGLGLTLEAPTVRRRWLLAVGVGVVVFVDALAARRMPVVALIVGSLLMVVRSPDRSSARAALALGFAGLLAGSLIHRPGSAEFLANRVTRLLDPTTAAEGPSERLDFYRVGLAAWRERPWLGWGFGSFRDRYAEAKEPGINHFEARVHDLPLEVLMAVGLVGMLALVPLAWRSLALWRAGLWSECQGTGLACAAVGLAYGLCLLTNFDQPGVAAWGCSLVSFALRSSPWTPTHRRSAMVVALGLALAWVPGTAGDLLARAGVNAEQQGQFAQAEVDLRRAVAAAPFEELYRLRLAQRLRARSRAGTVEERLALLRAGLESAPTQPFLHEHLAIALGDGGHREEALAERREAAELAPGHAEFRDGLARALAEAGRPTEAIEELNAAVALEPWSADWLNDRGNVLRSLGRREQARDDYRAALARAPHRSDYARNLELLDAAGVGSQ